MDQELEEQMKMLEGLSVGDTQPISAAPVFGSTVETAETLRGEVPFIPENPTNKGIVTNSTKRLWTFSLKSVIRYARIYPTTRQIPTDNNPSWKDFKNTAT